MGGVWLSPPRHSGADDTAPGAPSPLVLAVPGKPEVTNTSRSLLLAPRTFCPLYPCEAPSLSLCVRSPGLHYWVSGASPAGGEDLKLGASVRRFQCPGVDCIGVSGVHLENGTEGRGLCGGTALWPTLCPLLRGMRVFCASGLNLILPQCPCPGVARGQLSQLELGPCR